MVFICTFWLSDSDWTNRVIDAQDHASVMVFQQVISIYVQINIARVDPQTGVATGEIDTISLGGYVRARVGK